VHLAQEPLKRVKISGPAGGGGKMPAKKSAGYTFIKLFLNK